VKGKAMEIVQVEGIGSFVNMILRERENYDMDMDY
jgi:hypothetical protein